MATIALTEIRGTALDVWVGLKAQPYQMEFRVPGGTPDFSPTVTGGAATVTIPDGSEALCFDHTGPLLHQVRHVADGRGRGPVLASISPVTAVHDTLVEVTFTGKQFSPSAEARLLDPASNRVARGQCRYLGPTSVKAIFRVPAAGTYQAVIGNAGVWSAPQTFTST